MDQDFVKTGQNKNLKNYRYLNFFLLNNFDSFRANILSKKKYLYISFE